MTTTQMDDGGGIGLVTRNPADKVALRGVKFSCVVAGISVRTTVEQTFVNLEERAIEALYTFPLPEGAAVCGFEVVFFDKVFTGVVEETDRAIEQYDEAIEQGDGAYMVEQHRPDVFSVRVGNLRARQAVTIRLSYVMDLEVVDRSVRLALPTTIAPRYRAAAGMDVVDAMIDGEALNPPHVLSVPYGLTLEVEVLMDRGLEGITSSTHAIQVQRREGAWRATLQGGTTEMDREVVLELKLAREQEPFALTATSKSGEKFIAVNFVPEFEEEEIGQGGGVETVFVVDCSGSMEGESIAQATAALECCLRAMNEGDRFNVCRFGSTFRMLSDEPLVYSQQTLQRALVFVKRGADLGGTELMAPLEAILGSAPGNGGARNIVLLTDGQVSNEPAIIALARRKRGKNRFFTFGIGPACSQFLVKSLARVTGGAAEFIGYGERIEEKVLRAFGRMASPPVTGVEIEFGEADAETAPVEVPPIFDGDAVRVYARLPGRVPQAVTLRCKTAAGDRSWRVQVRAGEDPANVLGVLWARAMIRSLEEQDATGSASSISAPAKDGARVVALSKQYGVLCGRTSFIAVEHRSENDREQGKPALRRVPNLLARGWGGTDTLGDLGSGLACAKSAPCAAPPPPASAMPPAWKRRARGGGLGGILDAVSGLLGGGGARGFGSMGGAQNLCGSSAPGGGDDDDMVMDECESAEPAAQPGAAADPLLEVLKLQEARGLFRGAAWMRKWLETSGLEVDKLRAAIGSEQPEDLALTVLVLLALRKSEPARAAIWKRAAAKAVRAIAKAMKRTVGEVEAWMEGLARA